ncbi:MAG: HD domain-containing phosphohydrolase [Smithella sp.]|jgi:putative nucleotidyltransferase with HDIG domain
MSNIKAYFFEYFEQIVVLFILAAVVVLNYFIAEKLALLNLFYLPAILAGFVLGKRKALLTSIFSVTAVTFYVFLNYDNFKQVQSVVSLYANIISWGSFLILCSIVVGYLHEENEKKVIQLKNAYMGILEILSKYIESSDKYTQGHSVRVAHYATEIAVAMKLKPQDVENIKVAALLHDIGKIDISTELIGKAASLSSEEINIMASHSERGAQILSSVGSVLSEAIPLVRAHHQYFDHDEHKGSPSGEVPLGARILAVADSYDAMTTDRPYRSGMPPWKAIEELERCTGTQFDPKVVACFKNTLVQRSGTHQILSGD